jgi:hypothetical protein
MCSQAETSESKGLDPEQRAYFLYLDLFTPWSGDMPFKPHSLLEYNTISYNTKWGRKVSVNLYIQSDLDIYGEWK